MPRFGRRRKNRNIDMNYTNICFKPCNHRRASLDKVELLEDEMEAIRLSDFLGFYQQECANKMEVSRTTFSRILDSAHKKIADALLHQKALEICSLKEEQ